MSINVWNAPEVSSVFHITCFHQRVEHLKTRLTMTNSSGALVKEFVIAPYLGVGWVEEGRGGEREREEAGEGQREKHSKPQQFLNFSHTTFVSGILAWWGYVKKWSHGISELEGYLVQPPPLLWFVCKIQTFNGVADDSCLKDLQFLGRCQLTQSEFIFAVGLSDLKRSWPFDKSLLQK